MSVHEAVILGFSMDLAAGGYCFADKLIDFLPALGRQTHKHLGAFRRVTDLLE
jgi:hypothetical protein